MISCSVTSTGRSITLRQTSNVTAPGSSPPAVLSDKVGSSCTSTILPASSVPQEFIVVDSFPSTVSHKTDYLALERLARQHRTRRAETAGADPYGGDTLVAELVALWRELLQRTDVDADANFFAHGGHSLLGAQLVQRVEDSLATPLAMTDLYADPTPARLAARVRRARGEEPTP